jgi:diguanylate cyclase (GGDEF)-like protein
MAAGSERADRNRKKPPETVALSETPLGAAGAAIPPRFERQLRGAARRRRGEESSWVAVARVIGVSEIRERHGYPAAEEFLRGTASQLRSSLRESDKVAPVGAGEYGIILAAESAGDAVTGLERLVENIRELAGRDPRWSGGSLSIGVAPLRSGEPQAILDHARSALETAGTQSRGLVTMSPEPG